LLIAFIFYTKKRNKSERSVILGVFMIFWLLASRFRWIGLRWMGFASDSPHHLIVRVLGLIVGNELRRL